MARRETPIPVGLDPRVGKVGHIAKAVVRQFPARTIGTLGAGSRTTMEIKAPPSADETPYRSAFFVTARHSTDGNSYAPGDPIPLAEAMRQGLVLTTDEEDVTPATVARSEVIIGERATRRRISHEETVAGRLQEPGQPNTGFAMDPGQCSKCRGSGKRFYRATHKVDCRCVGCRPCSVCGGTGRK